MTALIVISLILNVVSLAGVGFIFLKVLPNIKKGFTEVQAGMTEMGTSIKNISTMLQK